MKKISIIILTIIGLLSANILSAQEYNKKDVELRKKIGQMLILGFRGMELKSSSTIYNLITKENIGGVILFDYDFPSKKPERNIRNPEQLRKLCSELQKAGKNRLFISINQEGGKISPLKEDYGFPPTVSQEFLGNNNKLKLTSEWAARSASTLKALGFNLNFAPCVDLNINPDCPIIGKMERSFSSDPKIVISNSRKVLEEYKKQGIITSIKHFPGYGSSTSSTYNGILDITKTYSENELIPFKELISEGLVDIVMTANVFNSNFDEKYPATMSYNTLTNKLKVQMSFNGIILSDDISMGEILKQYDLKTCFEKSINAGVDMFIISNNGEKYDENIGYKSIDAIFQLVKEGKVSENKILESWAKIQKLKMKWDIR